MYDLAGQLRHAGQLQHGHGGATRDLKLVGELEELLLLLFLLVKMACDTAVSLSNCSARKDMCEQRENHLVHCTVISREPHKYRW